MLLTDVCFCRMREVLCSLRLAACATDIQTLAGAPGAHREAVLVYRLFLILRLPSRFELESFLPYLRIAKEIYVYIVLRNPQSASAAPGFGG